jgi:hypothetical protein
VLLVYEMRCISVYIEHENVYATFVACLIGLHITVSYLQNRYQRGIMILIECSLNGNW